MFALTGLAAVAVGVVLVGLLHVVAVEVDPVRRTISQYALGPSRPLFDVGVLALSLGSVLVLAAAVRAGLVHRRSVAAVLMGVWAVALLVVVAFEKTNWAVGPSVGGSIHSAASFVAFLSLPLASIAIGRRGAPSGGKTLAAWLRWSGALALLLLAVVLGIIGTWIVTGVPVWNHLPLGLTERALALVEVSSVVVLGTSAYRAVALPAGAAASASVAVG
jgi:hypothetical protein